MVRVRFTCNTISFCFFLARLADLRSCFVAMQHDDKRPMMNAAHQLARVLRRFRKTDPVFCERVESMLAEQQGIDMDRIHYWSNQGGAQRRRRIGPELPRSSSAPDTKSKKKREKMQRTAEGKAKLQARKKVKKDKKKKKCQEEKVKREGKKEQAYYLTQNQSDTEASEDAEEENEAGPELPRSSSELPDMQAKEEPADAARCPTTKPEDEEELPQEVKEEAEPADEAGCPMTEPEDDSQQAKTEEP